MALESVMSFSFENALILSISFTEKFRTPPILPSDIKEYFNLAIGKLNEIQKRTLELYNLKIKQSNWDNKAKTKFSKTIPINIRSEQIMFVVEALFPFSAAILKQQQNQQNQQEKQENVQSSEKGSNQNHEGSQQQESQKKQQSKTSEKQQQAKGQSNSDYQPQQQQQASGVSYLTFDKGDKILVLQSYENGWWYGNTIKQPDTKGFFPSNYIQISATKPKPPPPPPSQSLPDDDQEQDSDNNVVVIPNAEQQGIEWVQNELGKITRGPVKSDYYLGIKGYKNVKIDEKNQNITKGDHVKFDVSTGLAKVPIKDQAPAAKAVRQMGYYFDYHQWNEERNKQPGQRARPDPKKKKIKKLNLKGMK